MPRREATIDLDRSLTARNPTNTTTSNEMSQPQLSCSSSASSATLIRDEAHDTIVVHPFPRQSQLPTPADSTMDTASDCSHDTCTKHVSRRGTPILTRKERQNGLSATTVSRNNRSISGDTLVASASQSSILRNGIAALDLPWSVSSLIPPEDPNCITGSTKADEITSSGDEESQLRAERAAARKAKLDTNAKLWEARKQAAEDKAVRKSSRASVIGKASETVSDLTAGLLGKRPRDALERGKDRLGGLKRRASLRPRSMIEPLNKTTPSFEGPTTKRRRLSDSNVGRPHEPVAKTTTPKTVASVRKDKRWLKVGLYTGQSRDFDGRLSESKNRRKLAGASPVKENKTLPLPMFAGERLMEYGRDFRLPYDVFSPLPLGQPKPDEWRKTNKNVFVGDAAQVWRHSKPREHSTCMCTSDSGCSDHCMNRFMFYECDGRNCNLSECSNRSFQSLAQRSKKGGKYNIGVEVIQTQDRGFGVRSNRTFEPNQIIVEYTGEIITQDECDHRMRTVYKKNECYYLMLFDQNMIIDATRGSIARFVNHSCEPNCRMEKWTVGGKPRMALFAGDKGVMTGDELTYDYNFDPFSQKNVQECRCGSSKCRGVLGPKPKDERRSKAETEPCDPATNKLTGAKRKVAEILEEGADRWKKRPKLAVPASAVAALKHVTAKSQTSAKARNSRIVHTSPVHPIGKARPVKKPISKTASLVRRASVARQPSVSRRGSNRSSTIGCISNSSSSDPLIQGKKTGRTLNRKASVKSTATASIASIRKAVRSVRVRGVRGLRAAPEDSADQNDT